MSHRALRFVVSLMLVAASLAPIGVGAAVSQAPVPRAGVKPAPAMAMKVKVSPASIALGRDVTLHVTVTGPKGATVPAALVSLSLPYSSHTMIASAPRGKTSLVVNVSEPSTVNTTAGHPPYAPASLQVTRSGYSALTLSVPIVDGSPATVMTIKNGLSIVAPKARPIAGKPGDDLFEKYHAVTSGKQLASLGLRDGTVVDLNVNTDVSILDPLHSTLNKGEEFLEVTHGDVSHQVQVGTAVVATKGTRLDIAYNAAAKKTTVTVAEGHVQVSNHGASVLVGASQATVVVGARPPTAPRQVDLAAVTAWVQRVPSSTPNVTPPVLAIPLPHYVPIPPPPALQAPTMYVTNALTSTTWSGVVAMESGVDIPSGKSVTIAPGAVIEIGARASLNVVGVLNATGTAARPIVFTSIQAHPAPGNWDRIAFEGGGASGSTFQYVHLYYGGGDSNDDLEIIDAANVAISNDVFADAATSGIYIDGDSRSPISNCLIGGDAGPAIAAFADEMTAITDISYGAGQQGIALLGQTIAASGTWQRQEVPITLTGAANIGANTSITVEPGSIVLMGNNVYLSSSGVLKMQGTAAQPIVFTSAQLGPGPGNWQTIQFNGSGATGSIVDHVQVFFAGAQNQAGIELNGGANLQVSNTSVSQSAGVGIAVDGSTRPTITNCIMFGDVSYAIAAPADALTQITDIGYGPDQQGIYLYQGEITHSGAWQRQAVPIVVGGGSTLVSGVSLTIQPGMVFEMSVGTNFNINGVLHAVGTTALPIVFTSVLANGQQAAAPGNWNGVAFEGGGTSSSVLDHVQILYAGAGSAYPLSVGGGSAATLSNDVFAYSANGGVNVDGGSAPAITDCAFIDDAGPALAMVPDELGHVTSAAYSSGQAGVQLSSGEVVHSATWSQSVPIVAGDIQLDQGAVLTLAPGTVLLFNANSRFLVEGTLSARGTAAQLIRFTSAQTPPAPGNWNQIEFYGGGANGSVLDHVQISYGGSSGPLVGAANDANAVITNSIISDGLTYGIYVNDGSLVTIRGCTIARIQGTGISLPKADLGQVTENHFIAVQHTVQTR